MSLPTVLFWERRDVPGAEHVLFGDGFARGTVLAAEPVPFVCRYEVQTDPDQAAARAATRVDVRAEGAGWARTVHLELAAGRWRVTGSEQGDLDAALVAAGHARAGRPGCDDPDQLYGAFDASLAGSPFFRSLPVRRLGLPGAEAGVSHRISVALILAPSLEVVQGDQIFTPLGGDRLRFADETLSADLVCDPEGFVVDYPGLARRVTAAV